MAKKTTVPVSSTFDKELFKRSVLYNVRTLYRKTMEEATDQQIFRQYLMQSRIRSWKTGWKHRKNTKKKIRRQFTICPWNS